MEKVKPRFQDIIENPTTPVLVDFFAEWCGPCHAMTPVIKDVAAQFGDKLKVIKVDIDKNEAVASHFKIMGVPTFILFKKGEIVWRSSGISTLTQIKKSIDPFI
jgi:thioredoxin 1